MFSLYRERSLQKKGHNFIVSMNTCIKYCSKKGQGKVSVININAKFSCHIHISQYTLLQFYNASAVIDLCNHFHPSIYVTFLVYFFLVVTLYLFQISTYFMGIFKVYTKYSVKPTHINRHLLYWYGYIAEFKNQRTLWGNMHVSGWLFSTWPKEFWEEDKWAQFFIFYQNTPCTEE
jgi:hypothetical protein